MLPSCHQLLFLCSLSVLITELFAQQVVPIELVAHPKDYSFAISGMISGNVAEEDLDVNMRNASAAGKLFFDANFSEHFYSSIHFNAISTKQTLYSDSLDVATLAFKHNDYSFNFSLGGKLYGKKSMIYQFFSDYSISKTNLVHQMPKGVEKLDFNAYKVNLGFQFYWKADWDQDLLVSTSLKFNRMWLELSKQQMPILKDALKISAEEHLLTAYSGFSFKATVQLNHLAVFCETQYQWKTKKGHGFKEVPGYTGITFYSIGIITSSTAILGKKKAKQQQAQDAHLAWR